MSAAKLNPGRCRRLAAWTTSAEIAAQLTAAADLAERHEVVQRERDALLDRIRALLATEPAVSEEWVDDADDAWACGCTVDAPRLFQTARQLHALRAELARIAGGEPVPRTELEARALTADEVREVVRGELHAAWSDYDGGDLDREPMVVRARLERIAARVAEQLAGRLAARHGDGR